MGSAPVVLITGASSGFGRATAERLAAAGCRVYGTSRAPAQQPVGYRLIAMDVDDDDSVAAGVAAILAEAGRVDVLVNNAGISVVGSIEDTSIAEVRRQLETNLFGVIRVTRALLPHMRAQGAGKILNVSSLGGIMALPFQAYYSVSKFAVEGFTKALRLELRPFPIQACSIAPGDFRTEITANRIVAAAADSPAYGAQLRRTVGIYEADEQRGADPVAVAALIERLIHARRLRPRYLVGPFLQRLGVLLERILGARLFEVVMRLHCGLQ